MTTAIDRTVEAGSSSIRFVTTGGSCYRIQVAEDPHNTQACTIRVEPLEQDQVSLKQEFDSLTSREREVLVCILKGETNRQIATDLCISLSTVKTHVQNMFEKTKVQNRAMLVSRYLESTNPR